MVLRYVLEGVKMIPLESFSSIRYCAHRREALVHVSKKNCIFVQMVVIGKKTAVNGQIHGLRSDQITIKRLGVSALVP